jgi:hypothetical protein
MKTAWIVGMIAVAKLTSFAEEVDIESARKCFVIGTPTVTSRVIKDKTHYKISVPVTHTCTNYWGASIKVFGHDKTGAIISTTGVSYRSVTTDPGLAVGDGSGYVFRYWETNITNVVSWTAELAHAWTFQPNKNELKHPNHHQNH